MKKYVFAFAFVLTVSIACKNQQTDLGSATDSTSTTTANTDATIQPAAPPAGFKHATASVNGIDIHYVTGGSGQPLVLLHGFGQNWYMWNRILPALSKHFTLIIPDLPGLGESGKPETGYDKKTMAVIIQSLIK